MHVTFDNYTHNQIVSTSIVILKGTIVLNDHEQMPECRLEAFLGTKSRTEENPPSTLPQIPVKVIHDKFVLVVYLSPGSNNLIFRQREVEIGRITLELQLFQDDRPPVSEYSVNSLIVYASDSGHEGHIVSIRDKVDLGMKLAQTIFSELLFMQEEERKSYRIRHYDQGSSDVIKLGLTTHELVTNYATQELWEHLARQIKATASLWSTKCKYVAFVMDPWKSVGTELDVNTEIAMQGLGGGGLAVLDGRYLEIWPTNWAQVLECIWNQTSSGLTLGGSKGPKIEGSVGHLYSKSLGGLVHELGHTFDLGHVEIGVMGCQYHHCNLIFAPFAKTASHKNNRMSVIRPDSGQIAENTFSLTKSSSTILHHHRWFQTSRPESDVSRGVSVESRSTIKSSWPLTTIELRDTATGLVIESWVFDSGTSSQRHIFSIGRRSIPLAYRTSKVQLVAQNKCGTILKEIIDCRKVPEVFTEIRRPKY